MEFLRFVLLAAPLSLLAVPLFGGCGLRGGGSSLSRGGGGSSGSSSSFNGGTGGLGIGMDGGRSGGSSGLGEAGLCVGEVNKGELIPLDMYVMLDTSASMLGKTTAGSNRWDSIKQAFTAFLQDPRSDGLGVGIEYFPLKKAGVPDSCTSDAQCGAGAPCLLKSCSMGAGQITPCAKNVNCPVPSQCVPIGQCSGDPSYLCQPVGSGCGGGMGSCVPIASSFCVNSTSCLASDYSKPAVPIAALPGSSPALISSINAQTPNGNTPTGPALKGAIDQARIQAQAHPSHTVITVLATGGLPTDCAPTDINQIAKLAQSGAGGIPKINTFVIGVLGPNDTVSRSHLDTIAKSGGTQQALRVDTSKNVTQQLIEALNDIRVRSLACDFEIPGPPDGGTVDYNEVNIDYTDSSGTTQHLYYVGDKSQCDPQQGGWYYDVDPQQSTPAKIIVCDSTCNTFKQSGGRMDTRLGCKIRIKPPV